jgi:hypothetical protein
LRASQRDHFGKSSEKLSPDQFNLPLEDAELAHGVLEAAHEKAEEHLPGRARKTLASPHATVGICRRICPGSSV